MAVRKSRFGAPLWVWLIRWISLLLAVGLVFSIPWPQDPLLPPDLYFHLDPLISLALILSTWVIPSIVTLALVTLAVTLIFGRVFCGYICPLGIWLDISGVRKGSKSRKQLPLRWRYLFLLVFLIAALLGFPLPYLFDPQGIFYRSLSLAIVPLGGKVLAQGANWLQGWSVFPTSGAEGFFGWLHRLAQSPSGLRFYYLGVVAASMFVGITLLERLASRFWCRFLCPLGALLSLFSRFSLLKRKVDEVKCNSCLACQRACPMGAIGEGGKPTDLSLCFNCKECKQKCPTASISFKWSFPRPTSASALDLSRRAALGSLGIAVIGAAGARLSLHAFSRVDIIRPPGAIPEEKFLGTCVGCMRCAEVCPTNIIVPTDLRCGLTSLFTPRLDFIRQGCASDCAACGYACPSNALLKLELEEKIYHKLGTAMVNRGRCLAWSQSQVCLVCKESCPFGAIASRSRDGMFGQILVPAVERARCVGCGTCEANCPVRGRTAIAVQSDGEDRASGTFPPSEKVIKIRTRRRNKPIEDDPPPGIGS